MDQTATQYATDALRLIGQMWTPGGGPSTASINEIVRFMNQMLDSWNTMRNSIYTISDVLYVLTPGQTQYTIGPGGDLNGARPIRIQRANTIYQTSPQELRLPIEIIDVDQWAAIQVPQLPNAIPLKLYYDYGYSQTAPTGLGTIYLWPGPQAAYTLELFMWSALNTALTSGTTLYVPPGYQRAILYNLAVEIMPLYPKRLTAMKEKQILGIAQDSKMAIERLNAPSPITQIDPALIGHKDRAGFNWLVSTN